MKNHVSITDMAKELGVSKTLVSLVLNNKADKQGISKKTQNKVLKCAKKMNYKPNLMARGLRIGKTDTIGLVVSDIANPFYSKMARYIEDFLGKQNFHLAICSTDENTEKESNIIRLMREKQFDGLIISSSQKKPDDFKQLLREDYPFVLIDRNFKSIKANFVGIENYDATYHAIKHLVGQGYNNVTAFAVSPCYVSSIKERINGFRDAMKDSGIDFVPEMLVEIPFNEVKYTVKEELLKLTRPNNKIKALFAINNNIAVACLEAFQELNINIPDDIAFVAFDDIDAYKLTTPPITAIDQPLEGMCYHAVQILLNEINKPAKSKKSVIFSPSLILRGSVKKQ